MKEYLAIDPGINGGWAYYNEKEKRFESGTMENLFQAKWHLNVIVIIENVPPYTGKFIPSSSAFKLGYNFGWCVGLFYKHRTILVTPQSWQKTLGVGVKNDLRTLSMTPSKLNTAWKAKLANKARELFPEQKITLKTSDAFCLLHHALVNRF